MDEDINDLLIYGLKTLSSVPSSVSLEDSQASNPPILYYIKISFSENIILNEKKCIKYKNY